MQRLIAELTINPLRLAYNRNDPQATADILNTPRVLKTTPVSAVQFIRWLAFNGRFVKLQTTADGEDESLASVIEAVMLLVQLNESLGRVDDELLSALFASRVFSQEEISELLADTSEPTTRANQIGYDRVSAEMVKRAYITRDDSVIHPAPIEPIEPLPTEPIRER